MPWARPPPARALMVPFFPRVVCELRTAFEEVEGGRGCWGAGGVNGHGVSFGEDGAVAYRTPRGVEVDVGHDDAVIWESE